MAGTRSDYILRMIEQLGATLRRMRARLAGGGPDMIDLLDDAERCKEELFGPLWPVLRAVDAQTAVSLVADERSTALWIELVRFEAEAAAKIGDEARAASARARAEALESALRAREGEG